MLRPFLLIGVGGSGGKTLRVVRDDLTRRLAQAGWEGDLPQAWQFVHIDVPTHADGDDRDLPAQLPERDYQGLVASGVDYRTIDAAMVNQGGPHLRDAVASWRPDPNKVNVPASKGAGQYRALGRIITVAGMTRIKEALNTARRQLTGAEVDGELAEVTRLLGAGASTSKDSPTVVVVSSIAGGSGAGAVVDVCDAVRSLGDKWASEIVGLLYAPDVFDYLPEENRRGVRPNSLATIGEILNGYWNASGPSEATTELFAKYGLQLGAAVRSGPRFPYIVGSSNEFVSYASQNDIYRALGRSLASWVTSPTLQDYLSAYVQTNWSNSASSVPDHLPLHSPGTETPLSAMGSARVGLGRDRFRDYASQHLARSATTRLLHRHEELRRSGDDRTEKQVIREAAESAFGGFLRHSGLDERGQENNDIIDALRPTDQDDARKLLARKVLELVKERIPKKGDTVENIRRTVINTVNDRASSFLSQQREARHARAARWTTDIQRHLVAQTSKSIALNGAPVMVEVLGKLDTELTHVREELSSEAASYKRSAAGLHGYVQSALGENSSTVITAESELIQNAIRAAVDALRSQAEAEVRELAVSLLPDFAENVLAPLTEAVSHAYQKLASDGEIVESWPERDVVPTRLRPAPNEFLVDPPESYPQILDDLVQRTVASDDGVSHRADADVQVILGVDSVEAAGQTLIRPEAAWVPRDHQVVASATAVPTRASFRLAARAEDVLGRAETWLTRPGTTVGAFMAQGLSHYLDPEKAEPAEHMRRLERFEGQFIAALNGAAPLVSINPAVLVQVHEKHEIKYTATFSEIPFSSKSPAQSLIRRVLESRNQWSEKVDKAFGDAKVDFIDIFTVLGEPYEPVVFDSLMRPIKAEWGARSKASDSRSEFWRWRRARPLSESLPMSPGVLESMVRGWFVAGALGQLDLRDDAAGIYVPARNGISGEMVSFPSPLLSGGGRLDGPDALAAILEGINLALLEVNNKESLEPIAPYSRLLDLGRSGSGSDAGYEEIGRELRRWILNGENHRTGPDAAGTWSSRREEASARFNRFIQRFGAYFDKIEQQHDMLDSPPMFDLRHVVIAALGDLRRAVDALELESEDGGWA
ncbi:Tubulin like [Paraoerskovia marina]|uniref:Tubulin like n=1 Tax=Paraoerskovia marina TaxID=545619 RepID=A0A1H1NVU9_9CELL|nr:tubulin-like doman-containing protein [Paraoerskovia marina]SDS03073.1 Tubulin like [Paraoerskovia marina]